MFLFLFVDLLSDWERINVDGNGIVKQPEIGQTLNDPRIRRTWPTREHDDGVVMPIHEKAKIALPLSFAVPAVLLDRKFGSKTFGRVEIEAMVERGVDETFVVAKAVEVAHGPAAWSR